MNIFNWHVCQIYMHFIRSTSSAVGRSLESNASRRWSRRRANGLALGNFWENGTGLFLRMPLRYLLAFSFRICENNIIYMEKRYKLQYLVACSLMLESCKLDLDKLTLEMASAGGEPSKSVIRSNWFTTFFPGNNGFPERTSAKMHPMLHISIAAVYCKRQRLKNYANASQL